MIPDSLKLTAADTLQETLRTASEPGMVWLMVKMVFMLVLVILLVILTGLLFKKFAFNGSREKTDNSISLSARFQVAPQRSVVLLKLFDKIVAIYETPNNSILLGEWPEDELEEPLELMGKRSANAFKNVFKGALHIK